MELQHIKPDHRVNARQVEQPRQGGAGLHVGTVDHLEGKHFIRLKASDSRDGRHHWIPISWVVDVDDKAVYLDKTAEEFAAELLDQIP